MNSPFRVSDLIAAGGRGPGPKNANAFSLAVGFHIRQIDRLQRPLANGPSPAIALFLDVKVRPLQTNTIV